MKLILLGSGPSLRGVYLLGNPRHVLAVNSAAWHSPWTGTSGFSADRLWIYKNEARIRNCRAATTAVPDDLHYTLAWDGDQLWDERHVTWIARHRGNGLARDGVNASTSGFAALNWAVRCGAKRILLLGYDYRSDGPHRHWYDEEEPTEPGRAVDLWPQWIRPFDEALPELQELGVEVMNGSLDSAITAFPKCTPEEGLRWFDAQ